MGLVDGVTGTSSGWLDGGEVVEVQFDPEVVSYETLLGEAQRRDCANVVFPRDDAQETVAKAHAGGRAKRSEEPVRLDDDTKYYLQQTSLRFLPMTPLQAARANGLVQGGLPEGLLSPAQVELLEQILAAPEAGWPDALGVDLVEAWSAARDVAAKL